MMPTLDELSDALRNADRAGDTQAARVLADEIARMRGQASVQQGNSWFAGGARGVLGGVLRGIRDPIDAGAQMLVRGANAIGLAPDSEVERVDAINRGAEQDYRQNWRGGQDIGFDAARMAGNLAATAPLAAAAPVARAGTLAGRAAGSAAAGAGFNMLQPVNEPQNDFWSQKAGQAGTGAIAGAVAAPLTAGLARVISPRSSPNVQALLREGVIPTPGQVLGGAFKSAEEKASSIPVLGSAIRTGQQRAVEQFDRAAINRALRPIGSTLPAGRSGREAIEFAEDALSREYARVLNRVGAAPVDDKLVGDLASLRGMLANQPKEIAARFERVIDNEILARTEYGRLTGDAVKAAESNLGSMARGLRRNQDYDTRTLGAAIEETQRTLRQWLERVAPQDVATDLRAVNKGWANFKRVQRAAASVGADEGVFTPAQLHNAVKALDASKDKAAFARGGALMQDLSEAGKAVLANRVPNSGTTDRALAGAAVLGPLAGASVSPMIPLAAVPSAMYMPGVQRGMASLLAGRQQAPFRAASQGLLTLSPALGAALAPTVNGLLQ